VYKPNGIGFDDLRLSKSNTLSRANTEFLKEVLEEAAKQLGKVVSELDTLYCWKLNNITVGADETGDETYFK
jgi:hypothetical protein